MSEEVKRYFFEMTGPGNVVTKVTMVLASDYDALLARCEKAERECDALMFRLENISASENP